MCYTGLVKRIIPFALTFAAGLFLASFFVSVGLPGEGWRGERRANKMRQFRELKIQNEELREKNRLLELEIEALRRSASVDFGADIENAVPPVDWKYHHPPKPPRRPDRPDFEEVP